MLIIGNNVITDDDVQKLELIENIIKETLRMRPPVGSTTARKCAREEVIIGNYIVPVGQQAIPAFFSVNYDSKLWHEPYKFYSDRFKETPTLESIITSFSFGPHVCDNRNDYCACPNIAQISL